MSFGQNQLDISRVKTVIVTWQIEMENTCIWIYTYKHLKLKKLIKLGKQLKHLGQSVGCGTSSGNFNQETHSI